MDSKQIEKFELWAVTIFILILGIVPFSDVINHYVTVRVYLRRDLLNLLLIYISYLIFLFHIGPALKKGDKRGAGIVFIVLLVLWVFVMMKIVNSYLLALLAIKIMIVVFNKNGESEEIELPAEAASLGAIWMLLVALFDYVGFDAWLLNCYVCFGLPLAIILYLYGVYRYLPRLMLLNKGLGRYVRGMVYFSVISSLQIFMLLLLFRRNVVVENIYTVRGHRIEEIIWSSVVLNIIVQMVMVTPAAWNVFRARNARKREEIKELKTALGKSDANLHFLKTQINPHFLFNALNTLYGTALQENAERTGGGIQKLGDMMRFMLQENMEDKISLSRDIEYLNNYISLQQLRIATDMGISIRVNLEEPVQDFVIAPMLLIPFVENAFKHGVSLLNPSDIRVSLRLKDNMLEFDVQNSVHVKLNNDPEQANTGIGLENVKQRLQLLYPHNHQLVIRETEELFFVYLTIELQRAD